MARTQHHTNSDLDFHYPHSLRPILTFIFFSLALLLLVSYNSNPCYPFHTGHTHLHSKQSQTQTRGRAFVTVSSDETFNLPTTTTTTTTTTDFSEKPNGHLNFDGSDDGNSEILSSYTTEVSWEGSWNWFWLGGFGLTSQATSVTYEEDPSGGLSLKRLGSGFGTVRVRPRVHLNLRGSISSLDLDPFFSTSIVIKDDDEGLISVGVGSGGGGGGVSRGFDGNNGVEIGGDCGGFKDEKSCNVAANCVWCKSGAIPSRCYAKDLAKKLPPGVFVCDEKIGFENPIEVQIMPYILEDIASVESGVSVDGVNEVDPVDKIGEPSDTVIYSDQGDDYKIEDVDDAEIMIDPYYAGSKNDHTEVRNFLDLTLDTMNMNNYFQGSESDLLGAKKLCDPNVGQAAGYFRLGSQDKHYFFWFFESRNKPATDPVILWMTGGPGCSSELALFVENGPCSVTEDGENTKINPYSWNNNASVIFIDQPAGTGFSYGTHDTNEETIGKDMDMFLREFFNKFSKYSGNKFYVFGESYAGHYVPATAHAVWKSNHAVSKSERIKLSGVGIGNGLVDPEIQYKYYAQMAFNSTTAPARVSEATYKLMQAATGPCIKAIQKCNEYSDDFVCEQAANFCNVALMEPYAMSGYNQYDMRIKCAVPGLCYDFSNIAKYLHREDVLDYLGVDEQKRDWESCDEGAHAALMGDWMKNYQNLIPALLEDNIPVLVYAGDVDYIVNYLGCGAWPLELDWKHKDEYLDASPVTWKVDGKDSGKVRNYGMLSFLQVYQAGHMVPMDKPAEALFMVNTFMTKGTVN